MSLNSPAITELTTVSAPLNLLIEWLGNYFDGNSHTVGSNAPVVFPQVQNIVAGQTPAKQPLEKSGGSEIRIVMFPRREIQESLDTAFFSGLLVTASVMLHFQVSAKHPGTDGAQSQQTAQRIAELLKAILTNPTERIALAELGFRAFQPLEPKPLPSADYAKQVVDCGCQLQYPVQFNAQPTVTPDELSLNFTNEDPLLVGEYLLGQYNWVTRTVNLISVSASYWPSQGQDVVLGLEIGGVQSGFTLTLPQGTANTDTQVPSTAIGISVSAPQVVRWVVLSAPDPAASAWHVTLNVVAK